MNDPATPDVWPTSPGSSPGSGPRRRARRGCAEWHPARPSCGRRRCPCRPSGDHRTHPVRSARRCGAAAWERHRHPSCRPAGTNRRGEADRTGRGPPASPKMCENGPFAPPRQLSTASIRPAFGWHGSAPKWLRRGRLVIMDVPASHSRTRHATSCCVIVEREPRGERIPVGGKRDGVVREDAEEVVAHRHGARDVDVDQTRVRTRRGPQVEDAVTQRVTDADAREVGICDLTDRRRVRPHPDHEELVLGQNVKSRELPEQVLAHGQLDDCQAGLERGDVHREAERARVRTARRDLSDDIAVSVVQELRLLAGEARGRACKLDTAPVLDDVLAVKERNGIWEMFPPAAPLSKHFVTFTWFPAHARYGTFVVCGSGALGPPAAAAPAYAMEAMAASTASRTNLSLLCMLCLSPTVCCFPKKIHLRKQPLVRSLRLPLAPSFRRRRLFQGCPS